jgi:hypothetical protein
VGRFSVSGAITPHESTVASLITPAEALAGLPRQILTSDEADRIRHGRAVVAGIDADLVALVDGDGNLLAVAEREDTWLQPRVVMDAA